MNIKHVLGSRSCPISYHISFYPEIYRHTQALTPLIDCFIIYLLNKVCVSVNISIHSRDPDLQQNKLSEHTPLISPPGPGPALFPGLAYQAWPGDTLTQTLTRSKLKVIWGTRVHLLLQPQGGAAPTEYSLVWSWSRAPDAASIPDSRWNLGLQHNTTHEGLATLDGLPCAIPGLATASCRILGERELNSHTSTDPKPTWTFLSFQPSFRSYVFETAGKRSLLNSNFPATSTCRASTRFQDSLPSRTP